MKRLLLIILSAWLWASLWALLATGARAQTDFAPSPANGNVAADFASTSAAQSFATGSHRATWLAAGFLPGEVLFRDSADNTTESAEPVPASPNPKFVYGGRDDFRWQLALGISLVRFRSPLFYATGVGTNTSVSYFTNQWLGFEGVVNTAFAPTIFQDDHVKYVSYGAGPKIAWRARKLEPWAHAIVGGVHLLPQTAGNSKNGFLVELGGGADYRIYPHLSARIELDWIKTHIFGQWENSAQANADVVLHF